MAHLACVIIISNILQIVTIKKITRREQFMFLYCVMSVVCTMFTAVYCPFKSIEHLGQLSNGKHKVVPVQTMNTLGSVQV